MLAAEEDAFSSEGIDLFGRHWPAALNAPATGSDANVVLMHGYGEHAGRYEEVAGILTARGHSVSALDARGHGRSYGQRGYVASFDQYVDDLGRFVQRTQARRPGRPLVLLGHSNGGLIALRAAQKGVVRPCSLALVSPLIRMPPKRRPVPDWVAKVLSACVPRLPLPNGVKPGDLTHDSEKLQALLADPLVHRVGTPRWYWSATLAGRRALEEAPGLSLPLLVAVGQRDPLVDPTGGAALVERAGSADKRLIEVAEGLHEVLNEVGRAALFSEIAAFVDRTASTVAG